MFLLANGTSHDRFLYEYFCSHYGEIKINKKHTQGGHFSNKILVHFMNKHDDHLLSKNWVKKRVNKK